MLRSRFLLRRFDVAWSSALLISGLLLSSPATAITMTVLDSEVVVDAFARAGTKIDDPAAETDSNLEIVIALSILAAGENSGVGSSSAEADQTPFLTHPRQMDTRSVLRASARADAGVTSESASSGGGTLRLRMDSEGSLEPGLGFAFTLFLGGESDGTNWHLTYHILNETSGVTALSIDTSTPASVPLDFVIAVSDGDVIRIDWSTELTAFADSGEYTRGSLTFGSSVSPVPVAIPEPAVTGMAFFGLLLLCSARALRLQRTARPG
jgi:hypothetical protein